MMRDLDPDDDDALPYTRPLDLALILDGHDPDEPQEDDGMDDDQDCQVGALEAAGGGFEAEGDGEDSERENGLERGVREPWVVVMAERDDAGEWRTVGEPLDREQFHDLDLAFTFVNALNRRDFGQKFDWVANPTKAWLAVRSGQLGALRMNEPLPAVEEEETMVGDLDDEEDDDDRFLTAWTRCGSA